MLLFDARRKMIEYKIENKEVIGLLDYFICHISKDMKPFKILCNFMPELEMKFEVF